MLTEFQTYNEDELRAQLGSFGYGFIVTSNPASRQNGLLVASTLPLEVEKPPGWEVDRERWLAVRVADLELDLLAVHIPGSDDNKFRDGFGVSGVKRKEQMWERVISYADGRGAGRTLIMGDFNTGLRIDAEGAPFKLSRYITTLSENGFVDSWRLLNPGARDFTWYSKRKDRETGVTHDLNGFRLDYIFASTLLCESIIDAQILHGPRQAGTSDHAVVIAEIDMTTSTSPATRNRVETNSPTGEVDGNADQCAHADSSPTVRTKTPAAGGKFRVQFDIAPGSLADMVNGLNGEAAQKEFRPAYITADWNRGVLCEFRVWGTQLLQDGSLGSRQLDHLWKRRIADGGIRYSDLPMPVAALLRAYIDEHGLSHPPA
ncbi:hypothetical protein AWC00_26470 [Mycobacterium conspicuum]|nr:hypothetical protein AWC00_26470 [Mycobacterium conspicuum]